MLTDPVTGFLYPREWVERCTDPEMLDRVRSGHAVLTSRGETLLRGFTTGTTAAAACKAAVLSLFGDLDRVEVTTNCGVVADVVVRAGGGVAECHKYPGDYPGDITAGVPIVAQATLSGKGVVIEPGEGIGRFSRDTSRNRKGEAAISEAAMGCIVRSVWEALDAIGAESVRVNLEVAGGAEIGAKTLNPRMGVEGGISILGTTGLVEPWDDHLEESNLERIEKAEKVVLTTGRLGLRYSRLLFPDHEAILVGARMEKAVDAARKDAILCGLPALILKFIDPDVLNPSGAGTVEELSRSGDWTRAMSAALARSKRERPWLRVVILDRDGKVLGDSG